MDDGSQDDTLTILESYERSYPSLRVVSIPHGGVASARNTGLRLAKGEYIAWIDPDDYVSPDWMASLREAIECHAPDVVVLDMARFSENALESAPYGRKPGFVDGTVFKADVLRDIRIQGGLPDKVIRARFYQGLAFDPELTVLEDYTLMPQLLDSVETVYYLGKTLYFYRQHTESLLHSNTADQGFQSVIVAQMRAQTVGKAFHKPATTAAALQALRFCRTQFLTPSFGAAKAQISSCEGYVRKAFFMLLTDRGSPFLLKTKFIALGLGLYRPCVRLVSDLRKGEREND